MRARLSILARGPGLVVVALVLIVLVAFTSQPGSPSHAQGTVAAPVRTTAHVRPAARVHAPPARPLPAPAHSTPRPHLTTSYVARINWRGMFADRATATFGSLTAAHLIPHPSQHTLTMLLEVTLHHHGARPIAYAHRNFFAVTDSGGTYPSAPLAVHLPALRWGKLGRNRSVSGWIRLDLPLTPSTVTVVWNDHNLLRAPIAWLQVRVRKQVTSSGCCLSIQEGSLW